MLQLTCLLLRVFPFSLSLKHPFLDCKHFPSKSVQATAAIDECKSSTLSQDFLINGVMPMMLVLPAFLPPSIEIAPTNLASMAGLQADPQYPPIPVLEPTFPRNSLGFYCCMHRMGEFSSSRFFSFILLLADGVKHKIEYIHIVS